MPEQFFATTNRFLLHWYIYRSKSGAFFLHGSNFWDFIVKHFCFIHTIFLLQRTIFCCIGMFIEAKAGLREFGGIRVSTRRRRITGTDPSEDAQSFPLLILGPVKKE
jgi:hypothetical protein